MTDPHTAASEAPASGAREAGQPPAAERRARGSRRAVPPNVGAAAAAAAASAASDFPKKATDAVQFLVDTIHDKAVRPAALAARVVVFGVLVAAMVTVMLVMGSIAALRLLDVYAFGQSVWLSYIVIGGFLTLCGLGAWTLRRPRPGAARTRA